MVAAQNGQEVVRDKKVSGRRGVPDALFTYIILYPSLLFFNYLLPLVILNSENIYPWPLGIMMFQGEYMTQWNLVLAFSTLTILPAIVLFLVTQRHIISGLTAGAIKG